MNISFYFITMDVLLEILDNSSNDLILYVVHSRQPLDWYIPLISHSFSEEWVFVGSETLRG